MSPAPVSRPLAVELDEDTWKDRLDSVEGWLDNVLMAQATFRKLAEDTHEKLQKPHVKEYVGEVADRARKHEEKAEALYRTIGRDPSRMRARLGTLMGKAHESIADLHGLAGGAADGWRDLEQMLVANQMSIGEFATAEQLGLSLGYKDLVEITFEVVAEKTTDQRILQEMALEMAPVAILYKEPV